MSQSDEEIGYTNSCEILVSASIFSSIDESIPSAEFHLVDPGILIPFQELRRFFNSYLRT